VSRPARPSDRLTRGDARRVAALGAGVVNAGLAAVLAAFLVLLVVSQQTDGSDFTAFYTGWRIVLDGRGSSLYDPAVQAEVQQAILGGRVFPTGLNAFVNPPHLVLPFLPLGLLPLRTGYVAWTLIQAAILGGIVALLLRRVASAWTPPERFALGAWALAFPSVAISFYEGSFALLLALAILAVFLEAERGRDARSGAWLALATLKPQVAVGPALAFLAGRRLRVIASAAVVVVALAVLASVVMGPGIWGAYMSFLTDPVGSFDRFSVTPSVMWNVRGTLSLVLGPDASNTANAASWVVFIGGMTGIAWLWRRGWGRDSDPADRALRYAQTIATTLLVSPHLNPHDDALLVVALPLAYGALRGSGLGTLVGVGAVAAPVLIAVVNGLGVTPETSLPIRLPTLLLVLLVMALAVGLRDTDIRRSRGRTVRPADHATG
jgi:hypothetical protein